MAVCRAFGVYYSQKKEFTSVKLADPRSSWLLVFSNLLMYFLLIKLSRLVRINVRYLSFIVHNEAP